MLEINGVRNSLSFSIDSRYFIFKLPPQYDKTNRNKDAYRPGIDRISQHALRGEWCVCSRGVCPLGLSAPGGCVCPRGDVCSWWGCLLWGDVCFGGCLLWGVSAPGGGSVCSWGVASPGGCVSAPGGSAPRGGGVSQHALRQTPPCEQNHTRL